MKLTAIKGVGPATAKDLQAQGFNAVEDLPKDQAALKELDFNDEEIAHIFELQAEVEAAQANLAQDTADKEAEEAAAAKAKADAAAAELENQEPEQTDPKPDAVVESQVTPSPTSGEDSATEQRPDVSEAKETPAAEVVVEETSREAVKEALTASSISFALVSGSHKGRTVNFEPNSPAVRFSDGAFASLETLDVVPQAEEFQTDEDNVKFVFIWGLSRSGAVLPKSEFDYFSAEVKKKSPQQAGLAVLK